MFVRLDKMLLKIMLTLSVGSHKTNNSNQKRTLKAITVAEWWRRNDEDWSDGTKERQMDERKEEGKKMNDLGSF